jgi:hypothetical protein
MLKIGVSILAVLLVTACAAPSTVRMSYDSAELQAEAEIQRELAFKKFLSYSNRLNTVSYPILKSASKFCPDDIVNSFGAEGSTSADFKDEWNTAANKILGGPGYTVTWVAKGGAAATSGVAVNDKILSVNGVEFGEGKKQQKKFYAEVGRIRTASSSEAELRIKRGEEVLNLDINLDKICGFPVVLSESDQVNAYANGKQIIITKGMMRFAQDNQQLSLVIAHELGHNVMDHMDKTMSNYWLGSIVDIAAAAYGINTYGTFGNAAARVFSQDFEAEADYVGLYYMHAADLPLEGVADFWRSMAAEHPASIGSNHAATHPATPERFLAISKTINEINDKIATGVDVSPNISE